MRRREFMTLVGGTAAGWPLAARAQQPATPVVGFLRTTSPGDSAHVVAAFRQGLREAGYVEGRNVAIEFRWAEGQYDRLPALAADLVRRHVAVIFAAGVATGLAVKAATTTIPIVFTHGDDPVRTGFVTSLSHPTGNITGVSQFTTILEQKRLGLLHELLPKAAVIALLVNSDNPSAERQVSDVQEAARGLGVRIQVLRAKTERELDDVVPNALQQASALLVAADPFFNGQRKQIVAMAARSGVPAIYEVREYAEAGGLMSYGSSSTDAFRQSGIYVGRILKGEKPGDLPVTQPTKLEFIINLKTAQALGLTIPPGMLAIADEVIE
jgi:putative ABC transport system substrate-binding protein